MAEVFLPGAVVGVLGGGIDAYRIILQLKYMGYQVAVFSEDSGNPAVTLADFQFIGKITDRNKLDSFGTVCDVIIFENYFVNSFAAQYLTENYYVPQRFELLSISQDNYLNSLYLNDLNLNTVPSATAVSKKDLIEQVETIGFPMILKPIQKTNHKNFYIINNHIDLQEAGNLVQEASFFVEAKIDILAEYALTVFKSNSNGIAIDILPVVQTSYNNFSLQTVMTIHKNIDNRDLIEMRRVAKEIASKSTFIGALSIKFYKATNGMLYVKSVSVGLRNFGNLYKIMFGQPQEELFIRAVLGLPLAIIKDISEGIDIYFKQSQINDIYTQMQIKPNWDFYFFPNRWKNPGDLGGFVSIKDNNFIDLYETISDTGVWNLPREIF